MVGYELVVVRSSSRRGRSSVQSEYRFVAVIDILPLSMGVSWGKAINARMISGHKIETDRFRNELAVSIRITKTNRWSGGRQVILHIWIAGWITTNARDGEGLRCHCRSFHSTGRTRDSRTILKGFRNSLR